MAMSLLGVIAVVGFGALGLYVLGRLVNLFIAVAIGVLLLGGVVALYWTDPGEVVSTTAPLVKEWFDVIKGVFVKGAGEGG